MEHLKGAGRLSKDSLEIGIKRVKQNKRGVTTYATIDADLKSTTGSTTLPNSSLALEMLNAARSEVMVIHRVEIAMWVPTHFLSNIMKVSVESESRFFVS